MTFTRGGLHDHAERWRGDNNDKKPTPTTKSESASRNAASPGASRFKSWRRNEAGEQSAHVLDASGAARRRGDAGS